MFYLIIMSMIIMSNSINQKFCVNCKFFLPDNKNNNFAKCAYFSKINENFLVTGIDNPKEYTYCSIARNNEHLCGKDATKYIRKYKTRFN